MMLYAYRGFWCCCTGFGCRLNRGSPKVAGENPEVGDSALLMWLQIDKCVFSLVAGMRRVLLD